MRPGRTALALTIALGCGGDDPPVDSADGSSTGNPPTTSSATGSPSSIAESSTSAASSSSEESSTGSSSGGEASSSSASASSTSAGELCMPTLAAGADPIVRTVYLVPTDRTENPAVVANLEQAIGELQAWYAEQLGGGLTFRIRDPAVEVVMTTHDAAWYATNPSGSEQTLWYWDNAIADAGASFFDPQTTWVVYLDADPACGQIAGAGTSGVTVLPANDIRGLLGEENVPPCEGDAPDTAGRCRWVGGLGHELGHALFLPHPPGCDRGLPECDSEALMYLGYTTYPDAHLTEMDIATLSASGFVDAVDPPACGWDCSVVVE